MAEPPSRRLVVNADDFGASSGVNRAVVEAHASGPVTSASLMVNMPAAEEAAGLAAAWPALSVGLHVNYTNEGTPVVPLEDAPACRAELRSQLHRFLDLLGRPPTHLDSHHNVHLRFEHLLALFREVADELGVPLRDHSGIPYVSEFYGQWDGETHPEQLTVESLLRIASTRAVGPCTELACHPGYRDVAFASTYDAERELEVATLCDPRARHGLEAMGFVLVGFAGLVTGGGDGAPPASDGGLG